MQVGEIRNKETYYKSFLVLQLNGDDGLALVVAMEVEEVGI